MLRRRREKRITIMNDLDKGLSWQFGTLKFRPKPRIPKIKLDTEKAENIATNGFSDNSFAAKKKASLLVDGGVPSKYAESVKEFQSSFLLQKPKLKKAKPANDFFEKDFGSNFKKNLSKNRTPVEVCITNQPTDEEEDRPKKKNAIQNKTFHSNNVVVQQKGAPVKRSSETSLGFRENFDFRNGKTLVKRVKVRQNPAIPSSFIPDTFIQNDRKKLCIISNKSVKRVCQNAAVSSPQMNQENCIDAFQFPLRNDDHLKDTIHNSLKSSLFDKPHFSSKPNKTENTVDKTAFLAMIDEKFSNYGSTGIKVGEWMDKIRLEIAQPKKESTSDDEFQKLPRTKRGGIAERITRTHLREKSKRVLFDFEMKRNGLKHYKIKFFLTIRSVSIMEDTVHAICWPSCWMRHGFDEIPEDAFPFNKVIGPSSDRSSSDDKPAEMQGSQLVLVIFKRKDYNKFKLYVSVTFQIHPPWKAELLPTVSWPVILCAYFIEPLTNTDVALEEPVSDSFSRSEVKSVCDDIRLQPSAENAETSTLLNKPFQCQSMQSLGETYGQRVNVCARILSILPVEISEDRKHIEHSMPLRFTLILQNDDGMFLELVLRFKRVVPSFWRDAIFHGEGRCYYFRKVQVANRINLKRRPWLAKFLHSLSQCDKKFSEKIRNQKFYYQLRLRRVIFAPEEISSEGFPAFCPPPPQSLASVLTSYPVPRFTGVCKVLFRLEEIVYLSDKTLSTATTPFVRLYLPSLPLTKNVVSGCSVLLKSAVIMEGSLHLDNYSRFTFILESSHCVKPQDEIFTNLFSIFMNLVKPLDTQSLPSDIVTVSGHVIVVDVNSGTTSLVCNFCSLNERLFRASDGVLYCAECSCSVPTPTLIVSLEVIIVCDSVPSAYVTVRLSSDTTKMILNIDKNDYKPLCRPDDAVGVHVRRPLLCVVRYRSLGTTQHKFYLEELHQYASS